MSRLVGRKMPSRREVGKGSRTVVEDEGESVGSAGGGVEQIVSGNFQIEKIRTKGQSQPPSSSHPNPNP
jgi:hypothetical protein